MGNRVFLFNRSVVRLVVKITDVKWAGEGKEEGRNSSSFSRARTLKRSPARNQPESFLRLSPIIRPMIMMPITKMSAQIHFRRRADFRC